MSGYAQNLEHRVITRSWITWSKRSGRMTFRTMYDADHVAIGKEMVMDAPRVRQRGTTDDNGGWIFRSYDDGVALFKRQFLDVSIGRRSCTEPIREIVEKYYYEDTTINENESDNNSWRNAIIVLRRKPLSDYAQMVALNEMNLGDYLVRKYNMKGES